MHYDSSYVNDLFPSFISVVIMFTKFDLMIGIVFNLINAMRGCQNPFRSDEGCSTEMPESTGSFSH